MNRRTILALAAAVLGLALLAGCPGLPGVESEKAGDDTGGAPEQTRGFRVDFLFEYRDQGSLIFWQQPDGRLNGTVGVVRGNDLLAGGAPIDGQGWVREFPESGYRMLSMKFQGPATGGRCGSLPLSFALTLTHRPPNGDLFGALTAYCGGNRYFGDPIQLIRISGLLEPYTAPM